MFAGYEFFMDWSTLIIMFYGLICLGCSIVFHEIGHAAYFAFKKNKLIKIYSKGYTWYAGDTKDYTLLSDKEYHGVNLWGIVIGTLPILFFGILNPLFFTMIIPYLLGCKDDLNNLSECLED